MWVGFGANNYLFQDGSTPLTDNWDVGNFDISNIDSLNSTSIIIGANTINTLEWAYLDGLNQHVSTGSSPSFNALGLLNKLTITRADPNVFLKLVDSDTGDELRIWFNAGGHISFRVYDSSEAIERESAFIIPESGQFEIGKFGLSLQPEVTISGGVATITGNNVQLDTEGNDPTDDLDTITWVGVRDGAIIILRTVIGSRDVVVKDGTGNIELDEATDFTLSHPRDMIMLIWHTIQGKWCELSRSNNQ